MATIIETRDATEEAVARRDEHRERNADLFTRRRDLLGRIEGAHGARRRRLERELRAVDTEIFESNRGLAVQQLQRWRGATKASDMEELAAVADAALWEAVCSYDMDRGPFGQWAQLTIRRSLLRAVRGIDHQTLGRADFERRPRILRAAAELVGTPSEGDIAAIADLAGVPASAAARVLSAARLTSLDSPARLDDDAGATVGDQCAEADPHDPAARLAVAAGIEALERYGLSTLSPREMYVITRAWGLDGEEPESLASLGDKLGVSREAARQVHNRALSRILHPITLRRIVRHRASRSVTGIPA